MTKPWSSGVIITKGRFKCAYCGRWRTGAYRWVDQARSCSKCNRRDDPPEVKYDVVCPMCKGTGNLNHMLIKAKKPNEKEQS